MPRVSQVSHYGRPEYSAVRCLLFGANLTDVGILRYVCLLFPDGKNILATRIRHSSSSSRRLDARTCRRTSDMPYFSEPVWPTPATGTPPYWHRHHVCADLRRRRYLQQPHVAVDYMNSVTGESLHPDLVNFDILAKKNYERFKARMLGEGTRSDTEPSDESVEKLSKAEMVGALVAKITSTAHGVEESIG